MKSRDAKTRVLYALNYFRAIQKRMALDLREFGTRDRIDSHLVNPYSFSNETNKSVVRNTNWAPNMSETDRRDKDRDASMGSKYDDKQGKAKNDKGNRSKTTTRESSLRGQEEEEERAHDEVRKTTVFDDAALEAMRNMASIRMYKINGRFDSRIFSTCPTYPPFPTTFGEPTSEYTTSQEADRKK
jgi:hypothetical protein